MNYELRQQMSNLTLLLSQFDTTAKQDVRRLGDCVCDFYLGGHRRILMEFELPSYTWFMENDREINDLINFDQIKLVLDNCTVNVTYSYTMWQYREIVSCRYWDFPTLIEGLRKDDHDAFTYLVGLLEKAVAYSVQFAIARKLQDYIDVRQKLREEVK